MYYFPFHCEIGGVTFNYCTVFVWRGVVLYRSVASNTCCLFRCVIPAVWTFRLDSCGQEDFFYKVGKANCIVLVCSCASRIRTMDHDRYRWSVLHVRSLPLGCGIIAVWYTPRSSPEIVNCFITRGHQLFYSFFLKLCFMSDYLTDRM